MRPFVSVIVPVYQAEKYLARCLDSILGQTYDNIEIIVVNDGSEDSSRLIMEKYANNDKRIITIDQTNRGASAARNKGLQNANGDYIAFVDSDDWLVKEAIEELTDLIVINNADIVLPQLNMYFEEHTGNIEKVRLFKTKKVEKYSPVDYVLEVILGQGRNWSVARGTLYKKKIIDEGMVIFPEGYTVEDIVFNLRYFNHVSRLVFSNKPHYFYQKRIDSTSNVYKRDKINSYLFVDSEVEKFLHTNDISPKRSSILRDSLLARNVSLFISQYVLTEESKTLSEKVNELRDLFSNNRIASAFCKNKLVVPYWPSRFKSYFIVLIRWMLKYRFFALTICFIQFCGKISRWKQV